MSTSQFILDLAASPLRLRRKHRPRVSPTDPRILVIRRNRMGDMIYTCRFCMLETSLFARSYHCGMRSGGAAIAQACDAVDEVILLESAWNPWLALWKNAARLQDFDWVIAAKGGYDRRLAVLTRLTNAAIRVGFVRRVDRPSACYTDAVALPEILFDEHQIETLLRLLRPLGVRRSINLPSI